MFCSKCGAEIPDYASYCHSCGFVIHESGQGIQVNKERAIEYAGVVRKCPACAEIVSSFMAICPSCGHELTSKDVSNSLQKFSERLSIYDRKIEESKDEYKEKYDKSKGFGSMSLGGKFLFVYISIALCGIPLIVRYIVESQDIKNYKSPYEKEKEAYVQNYVFPSDRENLIESLLFIKSKVAFLCAERINRKSLSWSKLWLTKAEQLKQKAEALGIYDTIAQQTYQTIYDSNEKIKKKLRNRLLISLGIVIVLVLSIYFMPTIKRTISRIKTGNNETTIESTTNASDGVSATGITNETVQESQNNTTVDATAINEAREFAELIAEKPEKNGFNEDTNEQIEFNGIIISKPAYFEKGNLENWGEDRQYYYSDENVGLLFQEDNEEDIDYEKLLTDEEYKTGIRDAFERGMKNNIKSVVTLDKSIIVKDNCAFVKVNYVGAFDDGIQRQMMAFIVVNCSEHTTTAIAITQTQDHRYSYMSDYQKICDSVIVPKG